MIKKLTSLLLSFVVVTACNKDANAPKFCWDCYNSEGAIVASPCDKTEAEINELTKDHTPYYGCAKR